MTKLQETYGVIGAGSFGTAVANLLAENGRVLLYARSKKAIENIKNNTHRNQDIHENIEVTNDIESFCKQCNLIFPVIPSDSFRYMLDDFKPYLKASHILIHATKGLHVEHNLGEDVVLKKESVYTMSELILKNTGVVRVGCMAGPNLASELALKQPAATVIASQFNEVIDEGQKALKSTRLRVYGSNELRGVELAGVLKNYVAISAGIIAGIGYGENSKAMLITRGMAESIYIAKALGYNEKAFLGIAGVGDLIATCNSPKSRNNTVGRYLAEGKTLAEIKENMSEVAEGVKTVQIIHSLKNYGFKSPIADILYRIIFNDLSVENALEFLMRFPTSEDADYIS
ncbi:MAG: NAD(P)H-dependent glycerol-3-phosphate dehydrogenase [Chitinophagales bacterium]